MKGEDEPMMTLATIVFVVGIGLLGFVIMTGMTDYINTVRAGQDELRIVGDSRIVANCLKGGIEKTDACGSSYTLCATDLVSGKMYGECQGKRAWEHTSYFNTPLEGGIRMVMLEMSRKTVMERIGAAGGGRNIEGGGI
jgi:hypothetical protein